ncbi:MAG: hypothetical protein ACP5DC_03895 [Halothiobacillaceae bacterium]
MKESLGKFGRTLAGLTVMLAASGAWTAVWADQTWKVLEMDGVFEYATGPEDLPALSSKTPVTPRMLMAYGLLPPEAMTLALSLRSEGIDLLSADLETLRGLEEQARAGTLRADAGILAQLVSLMAGRNYLEWSGITVEQEITLDDDTPVRGRGELLLSDDEGTRARLLLAGETVPAGRISLVEAAQWGEAPTVRLFRSPGYVRGRVEFPLDAGLVSVVPAPEQGHLAAVTVMGQTGAPQTVFMRRNNSGRLLWSAMPTTGSQLLPEAVLALPGGDYIVAGAGPVIRFDDQGTPQWVVEPGTLDPALAGFSVRAAAVSGSRLLLAGQTAEDGATRLVAMDDAGALLWQVSLADAGRADHLAALDDSQWVLAGTASDGKPAVALVDEAGEVRWQSGADKGLAPSTIETLAVVEGRGVVYAGQADGGGLWIRSLDPASGVIADLALENAGAIGAVNAVQVLKSDGAGGLLIGGEARTENGWLAHVDAQGAVRWFREYGLEDVRETLLDVRPVGDSLVLVGRLRAGSRRNLPQVWLMQTDAEGKPVAPPALPEPVAGFAAELSAMLAQAEPVVATLGDPEFHVDQDGQVDMALPWLTVKTDWDFQPYVRHVEWVVGDVHAGLGAVREGLKPVSLELPKTVDVRDQSGGLAGRLSFKQADFEANWDTGLGLFRDFSLVAGDALLDLHPQEGLMGAGAAQAALAQMEGKDAPRSLRAGQVTIESSTEQRDDGLYEAPLSLKLENVALDSFVEPPLMRFDQVAFETRFSDVDLTALVQMEQLREEHEVFKADNPITMFGEIVTMVGNPSGKLAIKGLNARGEKERQYLRLASLDVDLGLKRAATGVQRRDLWGRLDVEGLAFSEADSHQLVRFDLDRLSFDGAINEISPVAIIQLVLASAMAGEVDEPTLLALSQQLYSALSVGLEIDGFRGLEEGSEDAPQPFGLELLRFRSDSVDVNTPAPTTHFAFSHEGLSIPPVLIAQDPFVGQIPRRSDLAFDLKRLPSGFAEDQETVQRLKSGELDPGQLMIEQMVANKTLLDIPRWEIELPDGLIALSGRSWTEEPTDDGPGLVKGEFDLRIVNFDQIAASWAALVEDASQREEMEAAVAMVRLLGEKRENGEGLPEHVFRIEVDSAGKAQVNGEDLAPLLNQLGG